MGMPFRALAVLGVQSGGQRLGAERNAGADSGLGTAPTDAPVAGGDRTPSQSAPEGVDSLLRALQPISAEAVAQVSESAAHGLGEAEVQELEGSQGARSSFSTADL